LEPELRRYLGAMAGVGGASLFAQALNFIASPFIARLYGPAEFGLLGLFVSTAAIVSTIPTLGYNEAVLAANNQRDRDNLFLLGLLGSVLVGAILGSAAWGLLAVGPGSLRRLPRWMGPLLIPNVIAI